MTTATTNAELSNALNGKTCLCTETDGNRYCVLHGGTMPARITTIRAAVLAAKTQDAYSANVYRSWVGVARVLLSLQFSEQEAEAIMRSKWTRWAADKAGKSSGVPAIALVEFLGHRGAVAMFRSDADFARQLAVLVAETFAPAAS